ncbi:MAG: hypothetical protein IPL51_13250 [Candidatus Competibacteraceae bacterium]|nr:hypothetical protein [Candidatus Competibacteraceae bacterium]
MPIISFFVCVGVRGPIDPKEYALNDKKIIVSYPEVVNLHSMKFELPKSLSTVFVVSWEDTSGCTTNQLKSSSFERYLPVYTALSAISELLLAYKMVRIGHADGRGLRTVGIGDTLMYFSSIDGMPTGDLNIGLKNYAGNNAWHGQVSTTDPHGTSQLAAPHIGTNTLVLARRYVRCYELLEHGFYSEAFIVAFSILDDFIQQTLYELLDSKGLKTKKQQDELLRGIKENRLRLYLGPLLKITFGHSIEELWPDSGIALDWLNKTRNRIAHAAEQIDYETAAKGIFVCLKILVVLRENAVTKIDLNIELFRHAKLTAAWTHNPPNWIPGDEIANSMDFR